MVHACVSGIDKQIVNLSCFLLNPHTGHVKISVLKNALYECDIKHILIRIRIIKLDLLTFVLLHWFHVRHERHKMARKWKKWQNSHKCTCIFRKWSSFIMNISKKSIKGMLVVQFFCLFFGFFSMKLTWSLMKIQMWTKMCIYQTQAVRNFRSMSGLVSWWELVWEEKKIWWVVMYVN